MMINRTAAMRLARSPLTRAKSLVRNEAMTRVSTLRSKIMKPFLHETVGATGKKIEKLDQNNLEPFTMWHPHSRGAACDMLPLGSLHPRCASALNETCRYSPADY